MVPFLRNFAKSVREMIQRKKSRFDPKNTFEEEWGPEKHERNKKEGVKRKPTEK